MNKGLVNIGHLKKDIKITVTTYQMSTFSVHISFRITSGAIQETVPAKDIFMLLSFHCLLVPKSDILSTSL